MKQISDDRGTVRELFRRSAFDAAGADLAPFDPDQRHREPAGARSAACTPRR